MRPASHDTPSSDRPSTKAGDHLAEAARYAVLSRIAPKLRHDMAGAMQPIGMIAMVLQRRLQAPEPDLQAIAKNVASITALTREATTGNMNAMSWLAPREDVSVGLQAGVEEVVKLLSMELSASGLVADNHLTADAPRAPQGFVRSVVAGALLAFCDERGEAGRLRIGWETAAQANGRNGMRLLMRRKPDAADAAGEAIPARQRPIVWTDVAALAASYDVTAARGDGWAALEVPRGA